MTDVGNGERELAEGGHMAGTGWATKTENRLARLEEAHKKHADGLLRVAEGLSKLREGLSSKLAEVLGSVEGLRRVAARSPSKPDYQPYGEEDADAITGVESMADMARAARKHRAIAAAKELEAKAQAEAAAEKERELELRIKRWKTIAVGAAGAAAVAVPIIVEALRAAGVLK